MGIKGVAEKVAERVHHVQRCPPDMVQVSIQLQPISLSLLAFFLSVQPEVDHTQAPTTPPQTPMITHTDEAVGIVYKACQNAGYVLLITADYGNAEQVKNLQTGDHTQLTRCCSS
jgi:hypothetical protein